jgi:OOP family OmpA-OmpF porin
MDLVRYARHGVREVLSFEPSAGRCSTFLGDGRLQKEHSLNFMKNSMQLLASLSALGGIILLSSFTAVSQESRFYLKGDLGGSLTQDTDLITRYKSYNPDIGSGITVSKVNFDPGGRIGLAAGYRITDWLATEAESGATINSVNGPGIRDGKFANVPILFNVKLQYSGWSHWVPYVGAGAGFAVSILDADVLVANSIFSFYSRVPVTGVDVVFAYQAFAGLRYKLNERLGLGVEYRYFASDDPQWDLESNAGKVRFGSVQTHAISFAVQYSF